MKYLVIFFTILICLVSCESKADWDGYQDKTVKELVGTWYINSTDGYITFDESETFTMETIRGNVTIGSYGFVANDSISIIYAEDDEGNDLLTDDDYENGWYCKTFFSNDIKIKNLPYYRNEVVTLTKK